MSGSRRRRADKPHEHHKVGEGGGGFRMVVCQDCGTLEIMVMNHDGQVVHSTFVYPENVAGLISNLTVQYRNFIGPRAVPIDHVGHIVN